MLKENGRANAFYQKEGFEFDYFEGSGFVKDGISYSLNWYHCDFDKWKHL